MRFVDTNVLIYAVSERPDETAKRRMARDLLESNDLALSVQVLQEFYAQATRRSRPDALPHDTAARFIDSLLRFPIQPITLNILWTALAFRQRFGLSYWDCAILAAAKQSGFGALRRHERRPGLRRPARHQPVRERRPTSLGPEGGSL